MTTSQKISAVAIVAAAIGLFLLGRGCGIRSVLKTEGSDTAINKDSVVIRYKPVPYKVLDRDTEYLPGKKIHDTIHHTALGTYEVRIEPVDTAAILKQFYQTVYYDQTIPLKRGMARILDTVSENSIQGREVFVTGADTTITKTIVLRPMRPVVGYFTLSAMGNIQSPVAGFGAGFALKLPNDRFYQVEAKWIKGMKPSGEIRIGMPIRLKKKTK